MMVRRSKARLVVLTAAICLATVASSPPPAIADESNPRLPSGRAYVDPQAFVSRDILFGSSRSCDHPPLCRMAERGSAGEGEAIDLVSGHLEDMDRLLAWGLELERQPFHSYSGDRFPRDPR